MDEENVEIDDSLYSRQRYVLGDGAMQKLSKANVLIVGLGGVGVEIAKNVILAGIKCVTLCDPKITTCDDLGTQFFLRQEDVDGNIPRATACCKRLAELNPYVKVEILDVNLFDDLHVLKNFQTIVVTEHLFDKQIQINQFCRQQKPAIQYISSDVIGVFSYLFCDFGDEFLVNDVDGEEGKEVMIQDITKGESTIVTTLDHRRHNLETDNKIMLKEIVGMTELNDKSYPVKYINPYSFSIQCDSRTFKDYEYGGIFIKEKDERMMQFSSLESQLLKPDLLLNNLSNFDAPRHSLLSINALHKYLQDNCIQNIEYDKLLETVESLKLQMEFTDFDEKFLKCLTKTCCGKIAPLCAAIGGIAAQEVLKAISGKFSPLKQWLLLDAMEAANNDSSVTGTTTNDRYSSLNSCLSPSLIEKLQNVQLFMVGCGAIGCEMLKNFALLGVGIGEKGNITITDNDLIEKSNLNRQFLFRPWHIQQAKSTTAAEASKEINPDLKIIAHQNKVSVETQDEIYHDKFFTQQDIVINALDNVEARRYVDSRCVANKRPLIETGTMSTKGHVQVIVPYMTESYSNQRDPVDDEVPYCTLKSFPQVIEHTIQWARDKFESLFTMKPTNFNNFWEKHKSPSELAQIVSALLVEYSRPWEKKVLSINFYHTYFNKPAVVYCRFVKTLSSSSSVPDGLVDAIRLAQKRPKVFQDCLSLARIKFELYFNHKALQLLHVFPLDTKLPDGSWFWQSPKRPPTPIKFNLDNSTHKTFVVTYAKLLSNIYGLTISNQELEDDYVNREITKVNVPAFVPSSKEKGTLQDVDVKNQEKGTSQDVDVKNQAIETDDDKKAESKENDTDKISLVTDYVKEKHNLLNVAVLHPEEFEKDDDNNGHIDFITSASNLRAAMYNIEPADRFKTKRIAGKIIPAIATTTAAIAGLASIELLKVIEKQPLEDLKNCFLNLALPLMILSEPGPAPKTIIKDGLDYTSWDHWEVHGNAEYKLSDFIKHFKEKYDLDVSMVCQGVKMIYVPFMPGHKKRPAQTMLKLLKPNKDEEYIDLVLSFVNHEATDDADDDLPAPPVRYFYHQC